MTRRTKSHFVRLVNGSLFVVYWEYYYKYTMLCNYCVIA